MSENKNKNPSTTSVEDKPIFNNKNTDRLVFYRRNKINITNDSGDDNWSEKYKYIQIYIECRNTILVRINFIHKFTSPRTGAGRRMGSLKEFRHVLWGGLK